MADSKKNTTDFKEAFKAMLNDYKIESKYTATLIKKSWEEIMGKPIASRTKKISLYNKQLKVEVSSSALKNELNMSKSKVLSLLQKKYGEDTISDIFFI